jgi:hypothetical protein
MEWK